MSTKNISKKDAERQGAIDDLRKLLKPGDTVYVTLKHVSKSGMSRVIMPWVIRHNEPLYLGWAVAKALDMSYDRNHEGVKIGGCGMDMGFALVYDLSSQLFPDGYDCPGQGYCSSSDHFNGDQNYAPHHHNGGGYALRHRWF